MVSNMNTDEMLQAGTAKKRAQLKIVEQYLKTQHY